MVNSRAKGKAGELEIAHILQSYGYDTRRGQQYHGGPNSPDVVGIPGLHIEVKRVERLDLDAAMEQSIRDAGEDMPVVMHRRSRKPWKVTLLLDDFMRLWKRRGRWVRHGENIACPFCGKEPFYSSSDLYNFCPYCGAIMEGME